LRAKSTCIVIDTFTLARVPDMKRLLFVFFIIFPTVFCFAGHIAGGEVYYKYLRAGSAPNSSVYEISVRLFRECDATGALTAPMPTEAVVAIYNNASPASQFGGQLTVPRSSFQTLLLGFPNPCISNPSRVCYQVGVFTFTQELPNTLSGYIVMFQTCCRTMGIDNIIPQTFNNANGQSTNGEGATYTGQIPGINTLPVGVNSSPVFALKDTTLICQNTPFKLDFSASDPDIGDSLSYSFCSAYDRGLTTAAADFNYSPPPYNSVTYNSGFSGTAPLGPAVTINATTGIISGVAPNAGRYVVTVCITEWRNKQIISRHRKDFTLRIDDCTLTGAALKPQYITCDGFTLAFENQSTNSSITSYLWDFGEKNAPSSSAPTPSHTYSDTGTYTLKLKVTSSTGCQDSTTAPVKIYPGFTTDFTVQGSCFINTYKFFDASVTKYGVVDSWKWDFGDSTTVADIATSKDSAWKYPSAQTVQVRLITTNSKGCIDTLTRPVSILDRPSLNLPFKDTLICSIDTLMLRLITGSNSTILWTPMNGPNKTRILNATTATPLVFPRDTTKYYVSVNDNGCANTDTVTVNVLQFITVKAGIDTGICLSDTFHLRPISDALSYLWTASTGEKVAAVKYPVVKPLVNTRYYVIANLGKCQARDSVLAKVAPYPNATVGSDMVICFGTRVQLQGAVTGSVFSWSPTASLVNENTLNPIAGPSRTTAYVLSATDTIGCPKPKTDTILVTVIPPIAAYAGRDTTVLPEQPVQMGATGGTDYTWNPATGLNNPNIANPIAILTSAIDSITYTVRVAGQNGCYSEDQVTVRVFKTQADILVPSAFTPNGDGKNDVIKPIPIGISKLGYFSVYNRWGQLVFTTTELGKGWDGSFQGVSQPSGTYVYQTEGLDFLGNSLYRKGTIVLIR
jgi:gliding motility-associated-like protein